MAEQSREPEILKSIIDDTEYNKTPRSRNEEILLSILNDTEYTKTPQSREEELLLELKEKIRSSVTVEPLSVTENGTYTAPTGKAYSPVEVTITPPTPKSIAEFNTDGEFTLTNNLIKIELPNTVTKIGDYAFNACNNLQEAIFPESIIKYGSGIFASNMDYARIIFKRNETVDTLPNYSSTYFSIYVPNDSVSTYKEKYSNIQPNVVDRIFPVNEIGYEVRREWDFTGGNPFVDKIAGEVLETNNVSVADGVLVIGDGNLNSYAKIPQSSPLCDLSKFDYFEIEIDIKKVYSGTRLFVMSDNFGAANDKAMMLTYYNEVWNHWIKSASNPISGISFNYFDGKTVKLLYSKGIKFGYSNDRISFRTVVKRDNDETSFAHIIQQLTEADINSCNAISLGSHRNAMHFEATGFRLKFGKY